MAGWHKRVFAGGGAVALVAVLILSGLAIAQRQKERASTPAASNEEPRATESQATSPSPKPEPTERKARKNAPNVVVVLTDDQPRNTFSRRLMPRTYDLLAKRGARFSDAVAAPPLCCPFRAAFLSGQYVHNNGVFKNRPGYSKLKDPELVLPAFLREAGYRTGFIGKYLNGTTDALGGDPAPGWDRWYQLVKNNYWGSSVSDDGRIKDLPRNAETTRVLTRESNAFIRRSAKGRKPFFLTTAYYAPHPDRDGGGPCAGRRIAKASERDYRRAKRFRIPRPPNYAERNVSDKPPWVRNQPSPNRRDRAEFHRRWRCAVAAMQPVDRGVQAIVDVLRRQGELRRTWIVFGSDNGFHFGEHRLAGKRGIYEEMLQVPLLIRPPGGAAFRPTRGARVGELVSQVDVAATLLDVAGAEPCLPGLGCRPPDGRSLLSLLKGDDPRWPSNRAIPIQLRNCSLSGLRTSKRMLIENLGVSGGECRSTFSELYDLRSDPWQLKNIADERPGLVRKLQGRLEAGLQCQGAGPPDGEPHEQSCE